MPNNSEMAADSGNTCARCGRTMLNARYHSESGARFCDCCELPAMLDDARALHASWTDCVPPPRLLYLLGRASETLDLPLSKRHFQRQASAFVKIPAGMEFTVERHPFAIVLGYVTRIVRQRWRVCFMSAELLLELLWEAEKDVSVACPTCGAELGACCMTRTGNTSRTTHVARRKSVDEAAPCQTKKDSSSGQKR